MYKVFLNNTPIILSTNATFKEGYTSLPIKKVKMDEIIAGINDGSHTKIHLYHKNEDKLLKHLQKKLPVVVAGGGKVFNNEHKILFIQRNGKWDLPKGKQERGEPIEVCAVREVEEETGVTGLEITKFLKKTYHIFKRNGKYKLKITYWFEMTTDYNGPLVAQEEEDITKVKWKSYIKSQKALQKSYANIQLLFSKDYMDI